MHLSRNTENHQSVENPPCTSLHIYMHFNYTETQKWRHLAADEFRTWNWPKISAHGNNS